ncbi:MAG: hypothetical protein ABIJ08_03805 [Nanoarchaeota archaeon]
MRKIILLTIIFLLSVQFTASLPLWYEPSVYLGADSYGTNRPYLKNIPDIRAIEKDIIKIIPDAVDLDGDNLTYYITRPIGDDGGWKTNYNDAGEYKVMVIAFDGINQTIHIVNVKVYKRYIFMPNVWDIV